MATEQKQQKRSIKSPMGRGAYLWLWEPQYRKDDKGVVIPDQKPEFSIELILPWAELPKEQREASIAPLKEAVKAAIVKKWGDKPPKKQIRLDDGTVKTISAVQSPFRVASPEEFPTSYENRPEIHGKMVITFRSKGLDRAPQIALYQGKGKKPRLLSKANAQDKALIYPGAFYVVSTSAYAWEMKGKCGVSLGLNNVLKMRNGEPLGSFSTADSDFGDMPEDYGIEDDEIDNSDQFDDGESYDEIEV